MFSSAIGCNPTVNIVYKNRADCYYKSKNSGSIDLAISDLKQSLELDDTDVEAKQRLAVLKYEKSKKLSVKGLYQEAIECLNDAVDLDQTRREKYILQRSKMNLFIGNIDQCRSDLHYLLKMNPSNSEALELINGLSSDKPLISPLPGGKVLKKGPNTSLALLPPLRQN